jgi:PTH1 family peptidyl-tRNA hydrolase
VGGAEQPTWVVAGLGNPGREYGGTRHQLGFVVVDRLASEAGVRLVSDRDADWGGPGDLAGGGAPAYLVKPLLYMNRSGPPLRHLLERLRVPPERLLVVCDDVNLPLGKLRLRPEGSSGGHNGLQSVIDCLGRGFARLRLGVGLPGPGIDLADWVLERFPKDERAAVDDMVGRAADTVRKVLKGSDPFPAPGKGV